MSWKPSAKSSEHLRAKLDDEFETVAKPQGLRARRARAEPAAAPDEWQRTSEQRVRGARQTRADRRAPATMCGTMMERTAIGRAATGRRAVRRPMAASPSARAVAEDAPWAICRAASMRARIGPQAGASCRDPAEIEAVLDALEKEGWLSTERFAQSLVSARVAPGGAHRAGAAPAWRGRRPGWPNCAISFGPPSTSARWRSGASAGEKPADRAAYAKQARFLASRGFAQDVIAAYWAARATKSRPGRRVGPGPQTPGPKRQVSRQVPSAKFATGARRIAVPDGPRGPSPPPRLFR